MFHDLQVNHNDWFFSGYEQIPSRMFFKKHSHLENMSSD